MFRPRIFPTLLLAVALVSTFGVRSASADVADYFLTQGNTPGPPGLDGLPGPFAEVTVNRTSTTTATVTFLGLSQGGFTYEFGHAQAIDLNVNPGGGAVTASASGDGAGTLSGPSSNTVDGFGVFNTTFDNSDGAGDVHTTVTVLLSTTGSWASVADVLTPNLSGQILAAGIFAFNSDGSVARTGFASGAVPVPEPSTMAIAGLGALGFIGYGLRRRFKK